jgi:hypothetical protein
MAIKQIQIDCTYARNDNIRQVHDIYWADGVDIVRYKHLAGETPRDKPAGLEGFKDYYRCRLLDFQHWAERSLDSKSLEVIWLATEPVSSGKGIEIGCDYWDGQDGLRRVVGILFDEYTGDFEILYRQLSGSVNGSFFRMDTNQQSLYSLHERQFLQNRMIKVSFDNKNLQTWLTEHAS